MICSKSRIKFVFLLIVLYAGSVCAQNFPLTYSLSERKIICNNLAIKSKVDTLFFKKKSCQNNQACIMLCDLGMADQLYRGLSHFSLPDKLTRNQFDSINEIQSLIDSLNMQTLNMLIVENGIPDCSDYSLDGIKAVYLIVQHSALDYQKKWLAKIEQYCKEKCLNWETYATLYDRILINEGKKQYYGTQLTNDPVSGEEVILPISDKQNVDVRRKEFGMHPILKQYENELGGIVLPNRIME